MSLRNSRWEEVSMGVKRRFASTETFEGLLVSMDGGRLAMTNLDGRDTVHTLASNTKLTCDGTECESDQLQAGSWIRVTTRKHDRIVATCVEVI